MSTAFKPTVASSNTGSPVKQSPRLTVANSSLEGHMPLTKFGSGPQPTGNPHVQDGAKFTQHTQPSLLTGGVGHHQNMEMRNPTNGVPHIHMTPGSM